MSWATHLFNFYNSLQPPSTLPPDIEWLFPQKNPEVKKVLQQFLSKYYSDTKPRKILLGINPGRFGAGVTGINFTAPLQLKQNCGIDHSFKMQSELSAEFMYEMIEAYGGTTQFYSNYFISSVCPLGLIKKGKNINYYDDKNLMTVLEPFIIEQMNNLLLLPFDRSMCYSIGGEKNFKYILKLNEQHQWFENIIPLPHPRFIMQYKRKQKQQFIQIYLDLLKKRF
ncbi:MAG: DUF4918 family protein [Flavisolibacter sp.]|nr:DUF4918 family protein [Flavisolibacter sp.]